MTDITDKMQEAVKAGILTDREAFAINASVFFADSAILTGKGDFKSYYGNIAEREVRKLAG